MNKTNYKRLASCDLCGSENSNFDILVSELPSESSTLYKLGINSPYETTMCKSCGWIFKPGVLTDEQLNVLYEEYGGDASFNKDCEKFNLIRSNELYSWISKHANIKECSSLLDVGGGIGQVSSIFTERGFEVTVLDMAGGELVNENMKLVKSTIYQYMPSMHYDLILMNHVLEHVWDPTKLLLHAYGLLSDKGFLYVEVPFELITPLIKAKLGDPCHVGYFSMRTLKCFLVKCGYEVIKLERTLGWYNARRVMILRGLVKKKECSPAYATAKMSDSCSNSRRVGRFKIRREIFNATQIYIILKLVFSKILSKAVK